MCPCPIAGAPGGYCGTVEAPTPAATSSTLAGIADLERILGRLSLGTATPRELSAAGLHRETPGHRSRPVCHAKVVFS